ncbi:uncharacterized protein LOC126779397 [Nymphalis io]|uniref:uncharacterized protein LOC126779397 n=1 Tax=Inachis io TaxID=171585 RepID=UPI00216981AA|nr:uncharacterized protein LOC126779397 [Nymphalis io]
MNENFADLPDTEKNKYGKLISQKWKNIRDAWMKCDKKIRESKSGSGAKPVHKYQYYDNLQFLKKITPQPTQSGSNMPEENKSEVTNVNKRKKNEELNPVDKKMIKFMETLEKDDDSRMMSFFKGIAPTVERFKDEDIVEFQPLRRRVRRFNGPTDKRRSGREGDALRCRSSAATTDSDPQVEDEARRA